MIVWCLLGELEAIEIPELTVGSQVSFVLKLSKEGRPQARSIKIEQVAAGKAVALTVSSATDELHSHAYTGPPTPLIKQKHIN